MTDQPNPESKVLILPEEKPPKKEIKAKPPTKRQITTTTKWKFAPDELTPTTHQQYLLYDNSKTPLLYQQIRTKLSSYRSQDAEKSNIEQVDISTYLDVSGVIQKIMDADFKCFYCKQYIMLLYDNVREPRQWTLERLDNKKGHIEDNIVIACLSCNLRRRTMKYEKYVLTKEIQTVVKQGLS
jgi:hypothetical protein